MTNYPLPPEELRYKVAGDAGDYWFHRGGKMTMDIFRNALQSIGRGFTDFTDIYDFGCGCGRLTPFLLDEAPQARLHGSDIDVAATDWLRQNFPEADTRINQGLPPLPFRNIHFDLVLAYSVFTHLNEEYQDAWLAELHRLTRPGAILLLTINGDYSWENSEKKSLAIYADHMRNLRAQINEHGLYFYTADGWEKRFPDFYHTTWHAPWYIREHWSRWFRVERIIEGESEIMAQATVVLSRGA